MQFTPIRTERTAMSRREKTREQMRQEEKQAALYFSSVGRTILLWAALWDGILRAL